MRPTIKDVSLIARVSTKTVSRVLNREKYVSEETRQRVEDAVAQLNFTPSVAARILAGKRSHQVALLYDNHSPHYMHQIQTGIWDCCAQEGVRLLAQPTNVTSPTLAREVGELIDSTHVDGVILSSPVTDAVVVLDELEARGVPYVRISPGTEHGRSSSVAMDDVQAADDMTSHLLALGHRRIGFVIGHVDHTASEQRLFGYRRALDRSGVMFDPRYVQQGAFDFSSGEAAADVLLDLTHPPTAIFASNDDMAAGVLTVAHRRGLSPPRDLSVAGFDDTPLASQLWPPLTTVRQPTRDLAFAAASLLLRNEGAVVHRRLPHELVLRGSTSRPAGLSA